MCVCVCVCECARVCVCESVCVWMCIKAVQEQTLIQQRGFTGLWACVVNAGEMLIADSKCPPSSLCVSLSLRNTQRPLAPLSNSYQKHKPSVGGGGGGGGGRERRRPIPDQQRSEREAEQRRRKDEAKQEKESNV